MNDREAGLLQETDDRHYVFTYIVGYEGPSVSLEMPVKAEPYYSETLFSYFFNMLSEGANRRVQASLLHIDENDDFGILLATAQNDTIGAVTVKPI